MKSVIALTAIALASAATVVLAAPADGQARRGAMLERLKAADTNGDGLISKAEAAALPRLAAHFDQIDTNHDGQVSFDELHAFHAANRGAKGDRAAKMLKSIDTDGDGKISKAEALAAAAARFDRADANRDGFLTVEEMKAARHAHGGRGS